MTQQNDFSGIWHCCYWYPSNQHSGEDISEYYVTVHQQADKLILESLPNKIDAYMMVQLTVDGNLATGTWQENTSPHGEFKGMIYSGALQLIIDKDKKHMEGKWVGVGQGGGSPQIYTGRWELTRAGERPAHAADAGSSKTA